jgi:hypothetical protein
MDANLTPAVAAAEVEPGSGDWWQGPRVSPGGFFVAAC